MSTKTRLFSKSALVLLISIAILAGTIQIAVASEITAAILDREVYLAGQTGYISTSVYNDKNENISVIELGATVEYYYADGTVYMQKFFTNSELPVEIQPGQSETFRIPISLPTNIAPGFIDLNIEARTDIYVPILDRWTYSDRATYQTAFYVESPYKQSYEDSQTQLHDTEQMLSIEETNSQNLQNVTTILTVLTLAFAGIVAVLLFMMKKTGPIPQSQ
jgi:hypothetical protein